MEEILYKIYKKLGKFFTGSRRRREFYLIIFAGLIGAVSLELFLKFSITTDTLFWVFSSIVQSLMALVAFMGVVVVFKYQSMSTREDRLLEELNKDTSDLAILGGNLTATSGDELLENIKPHVPEKPSEDGFRTTKLRPIKQELESQKFVRSFLNGYMLKVTIYSFSVVLLSLFALSITTFLAAVPFLAVISLYMSIFFVADILRLVVKGLASTLL